MTRSKVARARKRELQATRRAASTRRRRRRRLFVWSAGAAFIGLLVLATLATLPKQPKLPGSQTSAIRFDYLDGREGSLADFAGKPLVVNFFASWCPTCWEEMDDIERVYAKSKDRVGFLGLALQETTAGARSIVERTRVTYPLASDPGGEIFQKLGGRGMPTTIFFDEGGEIVRNVTGGLDEAGIESLIRGLFVERRRDVKIEASCQFNEYPIQGREHITPEGPQGAERYGAPYAWNSDPPTSGWHDPVPAPWGVYEEPVQPAKLVHNLEHGGVVVQYERLARADLRKLTELVQEEPRKVVLAPAPDLGTKLAVSSWGRLMTCRSFEPDALGRFIQSYRDKGPEKVE